MNQLILGDAAKVLGGIASGSIDLTVTSPPYDDLFSLGEFDFEAVAKQLWRVTRRGGIVCWNVQDTIDDGSETCTSAHQKIRFRDIGFRCHETLIFVANAGRLPFGQHRYPRRWQYVFVLSKGKPTVWNPIKDRPNKKAGQNMKWCTRDPKTGELKHGVQDFFVAEKGYRSNVWQFTTGWCSTKDRYAVGKAGHPAIMPEQLAEDLIVSYSNPTDLVLDPFVGAGTTPKMAILNGRNYLGIEINRTYYRMAERRVKEAQDELRKRLDEWLVAG